MSAAVPVCVCYCRAVHRWSIVKAARAIGSLFTGWGIVLLFLTDDLKKRVFTVGLVFQEKGLFAICNENPGAIAQSGHK